MRIVTLEEHISLPEIVSLLPADVTSGYGVALAPSQKVAEKLADISGVRLKSMDDNGISMQVLSVTGPGANLLDAKSGPEFAKRYNDTIAGKIALFPDRFAAFAHLPTTAPEAAADELERTVQEHNFKGALVNGLTNEEFLDWPKYAPIFERAERLDVPIYLHPGLPPKAVANAYYSELPKVSGMLLSIAGWGWHSETALHVLRLILSGTFDRYPKLKLIIGHMGEMLPMMMARCDKIFRPGGAGNNGRSVIDTLRDQVYITTSGIFTLPPLTTALDTFGIDRILFSIDYPYSLNEEGKQYMDSFPFPVPDIEKIAHGNADKLLKSI